MAIGNQVHANVQQALERHYRIIHRTFNCCQIAGIFLLPGSSAYPNPRRLGLKVLRVPSLHQARSMSPDQRILCDLQECGKPFR